MFYFLSCYFLLVSTSLQNANLNPEATTTKAKAVPTILAPP